MEESERKAKLEALARCKKQGEKAYDDMYEAHSFSGAGACFAEAKESFSEAIRLANELGLTPETQILEKRLDHIKAVYRSQFTP
jgi:hypothetical protein